MKHKICCVAKIIEVKNENWQKVRFLVNVTGNITTSDLRCKKPLMQSALEVV